MIRQNTKSIIYLFFLLTFACGLAQAKSDDISGTIKEGYRILKIDPGNQYQVFSVYRGDYIKFDLPDGYGPVEVDFSTLGQKKEISEDTDKSPYFKMKSTGRHPFSAARFQGEIRVIEYTQSSYEVFTAKEAEKFIREKNPFILDVRTPREYQAGHLENSTLIPVQELQRRIGEIEKYKNQPVLIYCATGNRSTVASKILIDEGFSHIFNLRYGIVGWARKQHPIAR